MIEVVCGLIEHGGRILLGQRKPGGKHPLKWEFPGGKIEPGETPQQALAREIEEELGVIAGAITEMHRYDFAYPGQAPVRLIFLHAAGFTGAIDNRIYHALEWIKPGELDRYDILEGDLDFIAWLQSPQPKASGWFQTT
jgi:8-oxo-dGTP diphosphatase